LDLLEIPSAKGGVNRVSFVNQIVSGESGMGNGDG
jgi:hypothetical protein